MTAAQVQRFKDYLEGCKTDTNIDERNINVWCDLIEMLCYTSADKALFREDLEREVEQLVDGGIQLDALKDISRQMGFDIPDTHIFANQGQIDWGSDDGSRNDLLNQLTNVWFTQLQVRKNDFGDYYPFEVAADNSEIACKKYRSLTKKNKLYLYFLVTSLRNGLDRSSQRRLEFDFEPIAFQAFGCLVPDKGVAHLMGKGRYTSAQFRQNKYQKFQYLADILKVPLRQGEAYFNPKDTGENGIDFIGWFIFNDGLSSAVVYSGQATCMRSWEKKYTDSSKEEMGGLLDISRIGGFINALFIPYHFKVGSDWAYAGHVDAKQYVLFDRQRILSLVNFKAIENQLIPEDILKDIGSS